MGMRNNPNRGTGHNVNFDNPRTRRWSVPPCTHIGCTQESRNRATYWYQDKRGRRWGTESHFYCPEHTPSDAAIVQPLTYSDLRDFGLPTGARQVKVTGRNKKIQRLVSYLILLDKYSKHVASLYADPKVVEYMTGVQKRVVAAGRIIREKEQVRHAQQPDTERGTGDQGQARGLVPGSGGIPGGSGQDAKCQRQPGRGSQDSAR